VAAAGYLAKLETGRSRLVVSRGLHPHSRAALRTHAAGYRMEVSEVPLTAEGATDVGALADSVDDRTAAVFLQQPNFLGTVEELGELGEAAKRTGGLLVCAADPLPLAILRPPGDYDVDICVGEGQTLGNRLDFGGPSFGFFAAGERFIRRLPGRIAGETRDVDGRRGFVLTLQTREQHIRREKATHNICTSQALNALAGVIYLSWLGKRGAVELAELMLRRTHYARQVIAAEPINPGPVVREFAVRVPGLDALFAKASEHFGIEVGPIGEPVQILRYQVGQHFIRWHTDAGSDRHEQRRLSMSVELSEPGDYEGGLLELMPDTIGRPRTLPRGSAQIFPSRALHRVTAVTSGVRWALVAWTGA
jgi:glycine dehydrogenase subunit 1